MENYEKKIVANSVARKTLVVARSNTQAEHTFVSLSVFCNANLGTCCSKIYSLLTRVGWS